MASDSDRATAEPINITVRSPGGGPFRLLAMAVAMVLATLLVVFAATRLLDWNPFGSQERDRSGPVVLTAVHDLADYHAAGGSYQVLIDLQEDNKLLPDVLKGKRTLFLAIGSVDAVVEFGKVGPDGVVVSPDRRTVTLTLPHAKLVRPVIDTQESRILDRDLGVLDRLGGLFGSGKPGGDEQRVYALAEQKLTDAAKQSELVGRAENNTRSTLEKLLKALGFTTVVINFSDAGPGGQ
jgi:hypothetical protein